MFTKDRTQEVKRSLPRLKLGGMSAWQGFLARNVERKEYELFFFFFFFKHRTFFSVSGHGVCLNIELRMKASIHGGSETLQ